MSHHIRLDSTVLRFSPSYPQDIGDDLLILMVKRVVMLHRIKIHRMVPPPMHLPQCFRLLIPPRLFPIDLVQPPDVSLVSQLPLDLVQRL